MTLDEFVSTEKQKLDDFAKHWMEDREKLPEQFPLSLNPGEWDQQFSFVSE